MQVLSARLMQRCWLMHGGTVLLQSPTRTSISTGRQLVLLGCPKHMQAMAWAAVMLEAVVVAVSSPQACPLVPPPRLYQHRPRASPRGRGRGSATRPLCLVSVVRRAVLAAGKALRQVQADSAMEVGVGIQWTGGV